MSSCESNNYIWTMWWQGEENAPILVKRCIRSMRQNSNGANVIVITKDNFKDYVNVPKFILDRVMKEITLTHLSDIIRFELINNYGGIWIDSTVYVNDLIPMEIFDFDFFTIKMRYDETTMIRNIAKARWSAYLVGGKKHNIISEKMLDLFYDYWKKENMLISYFLIDYFMDYIIDNDKEVYELWDSIPAIEYDIFYMHGKLNDSEYDINKIGLFNKLSWKDDYIVNLNNKPTLYGKVFGIKENLQKKQMGKLKKLKNYFQDCFNYNYICSYGLKISLLSFLHLCVQVKKGKIFNLIDNQYNKVIKNYISKNFQVI